MDIFQTATEGLDGILRSVAGRAVTYHAGPQTVDIDDAVIANPRQSQDKEPIRNETRFRDWLIKASRLALGGETFEPRAGHKLVDDAGNVWQVYEPSGSGAYVEADADAVTLRIFTQRVS